MPSPSEFDAVIYIVETEVVVMHTHCAGPKTKLAPEYVNGLRMNPDSKDRQKLIVKEGLLTVVGTCFIDELKNCGNRKDDSQNSFSLQATVEAGESYRLSPHNTEGECRAYLERVESGTIGQDL